MKKSILYLMSALSFNCLAEPLEINETIAYSGTLANQNVFMTLTNTSGKILGSYFYTKYKSPIALHGSILDSKLSLIENTTKGDAYIDAEIKEGTVTGTWQLKEKSHKIHAQALSKPYETIIKEVSLVEQDSTSKTLSIIFTNGKSQNIDVSILEQSTLIVFEDFTFDGYPDMRILELEAGGNSSFIYFVYDPVIEKYITSSPEISSLVNPKIFHSENIITSTSKDGCCSYHAKKILPKELHSASYDYDSKLGQEIITNKITGQESIKQINEKYFEEHYLNFMGPKSTN